MNRRERYPYLLLAAGAAAYLYPFLRVLWRVGDEGTLVYGAQRVAEGAVPYRDFFEVMGPGTFYWLAFFFKLFGTTWAVSRVLLLITGVATALIVYWLARRVNARFAALPALVLLAITIPLWPATNHHWDSNLFALLAFAAFVSWLDNARHWLLLGAGLLAGITTLFLQQKGMLLLFSFLLTIFILRRKQPGLVSSLAQLLAGYVSVIAAVVLAFYAAGALPEFVYANVIWPASNYHNVNSVPYAYGLRELYWASWVSLLRLLSPPVVAYGLSAAFLPPFLLVAAMPALLLALAAARRVAAFERSIVPYWIVGAALWVSEIHRADITHLIYGSPMLVILCIYLLQVQPDRLWRYSARALALSVILFGAFDALVAQAARTRVTTRRGAVYAHTDDAALDFLDQQIKPGEEVFVYPYYPMYYFLSGTTNPTRFSILMYHINTEAQFREAVSALEQRKVRYVLWDSLVDGKNLTQWFPAYRHPPQERLIVEPYLTEHYDLLGYKNGFRLLRRKEPELSGSEARAAARFAAEPASRN